MKAISRSCLLRALFEPESQLGLGSVRRLTTYNPLEVPPRPVASLEAERAGRKPKDFGLTFVNRSQMNKTGDIHVALELQIGRLNQAGAQFLRGALDLPRCVLCDNPVLLGSSKTDENGKALRMRLKRAYADIRVCWILRNSGIKSLAALLFTTYPLTPAANAAHRNPRESCWLTITMCMAGNSCLKT